MNNTRFLLQMKTFLLLLLASATFTSHAQLGFRFLPAVNGQAINGLFMAQLQNASNASFNGRVKIAVRNAEGRALVTMLTPTIEIKPGLNSLMGLAAQCRFQWGNMPAALLTAQTGRFPEDEYDYCFEFTGSENKINGNEQVVENCFNYTIQPVFPLTLVYPADGDAVCTTRPALSWQPALPINNAFRYRLLLTEKKPGQPDAVALMNNMPLLLQDNIAGFMLLFPSQLPPLQINKSYVWQVVAYIGNTRITQSEIWSFSTRCEEQKMDSSLDSYRQLSAGLNGNFYLASGSLRFSINNPGNKSKVAYTITDLTDPSKKISNLPSLWVETGLNKLDVDMGDIKGLDPDKTYLLTIRNIANQPLYLRFLYKGNAE